MFSCKISKCSLNFPELTDSQKKDKKSFAMENFRLLTSHLKSRNQLNQENPPSESPKISRPMTTPNLYWNFMNFEERKKAKSPPDLEKTLQRLNIRSFNNILRSQTMKKKNGASPRRNSLIPMKTESGKSRKSKKLEYYTLDHVKFNNYKYYKVNIEDQRNFSVNEKEKERKKFTDEKEAVFRNLANRELIEKLKANKIYYFEKNRMLLKKQFEQTYKMSENIKVLKKELKHANINSEIENKKETLNNFYPTERVKWESSFFSELKKLERISEDVQKKMKKNGGFEDFDTEIKIDHILKFKNEEGEDNHSESESGNKKKKKLKESKQKFLESNKFIFVGALLNYSNLFKHKNRIISERILLGFGLNPKNTLDKITEVKFEEIYSIVNLISSRKELYLKFAISV